MTPVLRLSDVAWGYGGDPVVQLSELELPAGALCAVAGPNGSGKSTLLAGLALLRPPTRGTVELDGVAAFRGRAGELALRRRVTLLHQRPVVFRASVRANVAFGLRARGLRGEEVVRRTDAALERMGLSDFADRAAGALSGGETQRLVIARAFVLDTPLLLLDEPFASLDEAARPMLRELLVERRAGGGVVVVATHLDQLEGLDVDRVVELGG